VISAPIGLAFRTNVRTRSPSTATRRENARSDRLYGVVDESSRRQAFCGKAPGWRIVASSTQRTYAHFVLTVAESVLPRADRLIASPSEKQKPP
jgi:hypothetical protein